MNLMGLNAVRFKDTELKSAVLEAENDLIISLEIAHEVICEV